MSKLSWYQVILYLSSPLIFVRENKNTLTRSLFFQGGGAGEQTYRQPYS